MKALLTIAFSVFAALPSFGNTAEAITNNIDLSSQVNLTIDAPSANFRVDYPGLGEKAVCSLGLKLKQGVFTTVRNLQDILNVKEEFSNETLQIAISDDRTGEIALQRNLYVTIVSISTRNGRTLKEVLNAEGIYHNSLVVVGNPCQ